MYSTQKKYSFVCEVPEISDLPLEITVAGQVYYVIFDNGSFFLASQICPHQGGTIRWEPNEKCFRCPLHNWIFNSCGEGKNTSQSMQTIPLHLMEQKLWIKKELFPKDNKKDISSKQVNWEPSLTTQGRSPELKIRLLSHASLQITTSEFELLIDPWLEGPAMLGAWRQYPNPNISANNLSPDAIIITHEHSDHFHLPTLRCFSRKIPIYIPAFKNERIQYFLSQEGFENIKIIDFESPTEVLEKVELTYFKPVSIFNDSILFLNIENYKILNLNDAGLNRDISKKIGPVDLVTCIFSTGASGYPLAWSHLSDTEKSDIMRRACQGRLDMIWEAINLYQANYILPFASHVRLWQPEHRNYLHDLVSNTMIDVVNYFTSKKGMDKLVDLIPGDTWLVKDNSYVRFWKDRTQLYQRKQVFKSIEEDWRRNGEQFLIEDHWGTEKIDPTEEQVKRYFMYLSCNPDISYCEGLYLTFRAIGDDLKTLDIEFNLKIDNGQIKIIKHLGDDLPRFHMELPTRILAPILAGNLSWDEARVGYWIRWWRNTDAVHSGFLRLLQGPSKLRDIEQAGITLGNLDSNVSIASIIEVFGNSAEKVFHKWGMYCSGCGLSPWESVQAGALKHGLEQKNIDTLIKELKLLRPLTKST